MIAVGWHGSSDSLTAIMTRIPYGTRVRVKDIEHESDKDLNGLHGVLHRKFFTQDNDFHVFGEVGVYLDEPLDGARVINVHRSEIERLPV